MINEVEILAPAGAREQLEAAVRSGTDAVYLGYGAFNARRRAKNFTLGELKEAIEYCHERGVKAHIALNTLLFDDEIPVAFKDACDVYALGADAVIVQDLGLAYLIHKYLPDFPMHASTQLTVHNLSGAKLLERLGFTRVVLARELSMNEIKAVTAGTSLETEVFIHGALCMCVSGGCYLSSVLGQRSGNRGLCAQPCRLDFNLNGREYALSLKDMCHIKYINGLKEAGVKSFKIEGRMKRPEYVAEAVSACRRALRGEDVKLERLKAVFSRSGFTDGYISGKRNADMFGHRQREDVAASQGVLKEIEATYKDEPSSVPLWGEITVSCEKNIFTVTDGENTATAVGAPAQAAQSRPTTSADIEKQLKKTGGTPYYFEELIVNAAENVFIPVSELNSMRRAVIEQIQIKRRAIEREVKYASGEAAGLLGEGFLAECVSPEQIAENELAAIKNNRKRERNIIRAENAAQLKQIDGDFDFALSVDELDEGILKRFPNIIGEIPSLVFASDENEMLDKLKEKKSEGLKYGLCDNVGAVEACIEAGLKPVCSWGMNLLNSLTAQVLLSLGAVRCIASFEVNAGKYRRMTGEAFGLVGYGFLPLMRMRACPAKGGSGCGDCKGENILRDRMGKRFRLACNERKYTTLYNSLPLYVGDKKIGADFYMLYFTSEAPEQVKRIVKLFTEEGEPEFERTNGLYFKNLL